MPTFLADYCPPPAHLETIELHFHLDPEKTIVTSLMHLSLQEKREQRLFFCGARQTLLSLELGVDLTLRPPRSQMRARGEKKQKEHHQRFDFDPESKTLVTSSLQEGCKRPPPSLFIMEEEGFSLDLDAASSLMGSNSFFLQVQSSHNPSANTTLQGLYTSDALLCTQCEPHGMRHITFHPDRPDLLSRYKVHIEAPYSLYQTLLSNGNLIEHYRKGEHQYVVWEDPHPKPSYLFALVAGSFDCLQEEIEQQGRSILLEIYTPPGKAHRAKRAMWALKEAMQWDERVYGLSYDLDRFMIVAVSDFNAGAMENKGLNIFNAASLLCDEEVSEDREVLHIDRIVAHEYFHNWSGNRVTLRDWFQLTLKEGLTVFREQQFSAQLHDPAIERLEEIDFLQTVQWTEDQGPTSHPILPKQYEEIDNFYTTTIYDKGAEILRMLYELLGEALYQQVMRDYFERFDGKAITALDFFQLCLEHYNQNSSKKARGCFDLALFESWYHEAGTPRLHWSLTSPHQLQLTQLPPQNCSSTPLFLFPLEITLYCKQRKEPLPFQIKGIDAPAAPKQIAVISSAHTTLHLLHDASQPAIALNSSLSAPIICEELQEDQAAKPKQALFLALEAAKDPLLQLQSLRSYLHGHFERALMLPQEDLIALERSFLTQEIASLYQSYLQSALHQTSSPHLDAARLRLPSVPTLLKQQETMQIERTLFLHQKLRYFLAQACQEPLISLYSDLANKTPGSLSSKESDIFFSYSSCGKRAFLAALLSFLALRPAGESLLLAQAEQSRSMTLRLTALALLLEINHPRAQELLAPLQQEGRNDPLKLPKWFALQAAAPHCSLEEIQQLQKAPSYDARRPKLLRALIGTFIQNPSFALSYERTYPWLREQILTLDRDNPHLAAALLAPFKLIKRLDPKRQALAQVQLQEMQGSKTISKQTLEIVTACLTF